MDLPTDVVFCLRQKKIIYLHIDPACLLSPETDGMTLISPGLDCKNIGSDGGDGGLTLNNDLKWDNHFSVKMST